MRGSHILWLVLAGAVCGLSLFGMMVWRATTVERAAAVEAERQFAAARAPFGSMPAMLHRDSSGRLVAAVPFVDGGKPAPARLGVLAYRTREGRLVRTSVPFWFIRLKGPAVGYALRDTGLDLRQLGLTPAELERHGRGIVVDETNSNGDRLLVWTE